MCQITDANITIILISNKKNGASFSDAPFLIIIETFRETSQRWLYFPSLSFLYPS